MQKICWKTAFLGLPLMLAACNTVAQKPEIKAVDKEVPDVVREVADSDTQFKCEDLSGASQAALLSRADLLDRDNLFRPRGMESQQFRWTPETTPGTMQDMLYTTKSLLNKFYYGYSDQDLNAVHDAAYDKVKEVYPDHLSTYFLDDNTDSLMNEYISSIGDPHTYYYPADRFPDFLASLEGAAAPTPRVGINFNIDERVEGAVITDVRPDGPAYAAGLRRGDVVTSINGVPLSWGDKTEAEYWQFVGEQFAILARSDKPLPFTFDRAGTQRVSTMRGANLGAYLPYGEMLTAENGSHHYYLRVPTFSYNGVAQRAHDLVAEAQADGAQSVILDLRGNGGGYLKEWVGVAAAFDPDHAAQQVRFNDASESSLYFEDGSVNFSYSCQQPGPVMAIDNPQDFDGELIILVDSGSASSSEMLTKTLAMAGRAEVIGETTAGLMDTSNYIFELPGRWNYAPRGLSVTYGRVKLGGEFAEANYTPTVQVAEDIYKLAQGDDQMLQKALDIASN